MMFFHNTEGHSLRPEFPNKPVPTDVPATPFTTLMPLRLNTPTDHVWFAPLRGHSNTDRPA